MGGGGEYRHGSGRGRHERRGQTSVIATALLIGITVAGLSIVAVLGAGLLTDTRTATTNGAAEHAMLEFDSQTSLVAHGPATNQRATLVTGQKGSVSVSPDAGWLNVSIVNETNGTVRYPVLNATLGAVVYEQGETRIAYQGGGVWRRGNGGSRVLSPPEMHYRETTLTLPLVTVRGGGALGRHARITQAHPPVAHFPNRSANVTNPLTEGKVRVTVHSAYYRGWGAFFRQRFGASVSYDHDSQRATIVLSTPERHEESVSAAVSSSAVSGTLTLSGSGSFPAFTDSYNSSKGNYSATNSSNGTVTTAGDVDVSGNARVEGNVRAGGAVTLSGTSTVNGTVHWTSGFSASGGADYDNQSQIDGVATQAAVSTRVTRKVERLATHNNNSETTAIDGNRLNFSGSTLTLSHTGTGRYYLQQIDIDGRHLIIDTEGKDVLIGVEDGIQLDDAGGNAANITVRGTGQVRFYVKEDISLADQSTVYVPAERSRRLWMYGTERTDITLAGSSSKSPRFVGVIYAPSGAGDADALVQHAAVYGGIVAGQVDIGTGGAIHYDQALVTADPFPTNEDVPTLTFLHVSTTQVNVTSA